jgi:2-haloacid dehalogenase
MQAQAQQRASWTQPSGRVEAIHVASAAGGPMASLERARAIKGVGLEGDRYANGSGHWSTDTGSGRALTLVEAEVLDSLASEHGMQLPPGATRRNLTTRGIRLDELIGHEFRIGAVRCRAMRRAEPCAYLEGMIGRDVLVPLVHRAGIRADIVSGGEIAIGAAVVPIPETAVVFDLGGVLLDWNPRYLYRQLFPDDETAMERFLADVCSAEWNARLDGGEPWAVAIADLVDRHPEHADLIRAYRERFSEMLQGPFPANLELVEALRQRGTPLYALTNWSEETFEKTRPDYSFLDWFEDIIVSGREGVAKPDERIFRIMLERFGLEPAQTVFVDDSKANVEAAQRVGIDAIHYHTSAGLRADLERRSLLD